MVLRRGLVKDIDEEEIQESLISEFKVLKVKRLNKKKYTFK